MSGYKILRKYSGCDEITCRKELMEFFKANNVACDPKTTPWCAAAVKAAETADGKDTKVLNLMARSGLKYGTPVQLKDAREGDVVVFKRGAPPSGHISYFVRLEGDYVVCFGGNQSDRVCESKYPVSGLIGIRRPI